MQASSSSMPNGLFVLNNTSFYFIGRLAFELVGNPDILRVFYVNSAYYRLPLQSIYKSAHLNEHFLPFSAHFDEQFACCYNISLAIQAQASASAKA